MTNELDFIKKEFNKIIQSIFDNPNNIKKYIGSNYIRSEKIFTILKIIENYNIFDCGCCRKFDYNKVSGFINEELYPLIDFAKTKVKHITFK